MTSEPEPKEFKSRSAIARHAADEFLENARKIYREYGLLRRSIIIPTVYGFYPIAVGISLVPAFRYYDRTEEGTYVFNEDRATKDLRRIGFPI